jgi:hypothetical protein
MKPASGFDEFFALSHNLDPLRSISSEPLLFMTSRAMTSGYGLSNNCPASMLSKEVI